MRVRQVLLAVMLFGSGGGAVIAQDVVTYDPNQLPAVHGKVGEYSLTPRGDVDGLILTDGTEVHLPPYLGTQVVFAVKPGDVVTVHGLRARTIPMVQAMSVSNDATGETIMDNGPGGPGRPEGDEQPMTAQGHIKEQLHGPQGDLNGALLEDGTIVRLPPAEAHRLAVELTPGASLYVEGIGVAGSLGRAIAARTIGPNPSRVAQIEAPPPGPGRRPPPPFGPGVAPPLEPGAPPPPR